MNQYKSLAPMSTRYQHQASEWFIDIPRAGDCDLIWTIYFPTCTTMYRKRQKDQLFRASIFLIEHIRNCETSKNWLPHASIMIVQREGRTCNHLVSGHQTRQSLVRLFRNVLGHHLSFNILGQTLTAYVSFFVQTNKNSPQVCHAISICLQQKFQ